MKSLNTKLKKNKYHLYIDVADFESREVILAARPPHISVEEWSTLLDYWSSEVFKKKNKTNKKNQTNFVIPLQCGTKLVLRHRKKMIAENLDAPEPSRTYMYIWLHDKTLPEVVAVIE